jgi:hypothetical protein
MFNYPNGKTVMNSIIWLLGAIEFVFGLLVIISSFIPTIESLTAVGMEAIEPFLGPALANGLLVVGIVLIISSFPTLMFAEIHMKSVQTNKMTQKIYDRLKK